MNIFLSCVFSAQKNCLMEMVLLSIHNICFVLEIRKLIFECTLSLLPGGLAKITFSQLVSSADNLCKHVR